MKIAFYFDNKGIKDLDFSNICEDNPGCAGTEYMFYLVATLLAKRDNGITPIFLSPFESRVATILTHTLCPNLKSAIQYCKDSNVKKLIVKHDADEVLTRTFDDIPSDLKIIIWSHVFMSFWELDYYASNSNIFKIVNVGREALDLYIDHPAYRKSTFIYNSVSEKDLSSCVKSNDFKERANVVTYMGSLVPFKGFHLLAQAWNRVLSEVPDAQLYVIGSGQLYNRYATLGKLGIAQRDYEELFMPFISVDGKIIPSVHFMGRMGEEKKNILLKTKVGVPNPSGKTETFCISAVEMQMAGARVTTINYPGFIDTVKNGILYTSLEQLSKSIIELLRSEYSSYDETVTYFRDNFSQEVVIKKWEELIIRDNLSIGRTSNLKYRYKWLKILLKNVKSLLPFCKRLPHLERILLYIERRKHGKITYLDM